MFIAYENNEMAFQLRWDFVLGDLVSPFFLLPFPEGTSQECELLRVTERLCLKPKCTGADFSPVATR